MTSVEPRRRGVATYMADDTTPTGSGDAGPRNNDEQQNPYREPDNSTVDDWFGQDVERDTATAERAVAEAGGDLDRAEEIFEAEREPHRNDRFDVPADERP